MTDRTERERDLADLMRCAQDGDRQAYNRLLREVAPLLRAQIRRARPYLQTDQIEDIVQDVLLSLHVARATYDPARPFLPWLATISFNRQADAARRYARSGAHETLVDQIPETFLDEAANMSSETYGDPQALHHAMEQLPAGQRRAVELLKLRELSLKEASATSGMSIGSLKVAVHRGMNALRKTLLAKA